MDWEADPVLKEIRLQFILSFPTRLEKLRELISKIPVKISVNELNKAELVEACILSHNLAGAAESYGFPTLSRISGYLDDFLNLSEEKTSHQVLQFLSLLADSVEAAIQNNQDPSNFGTDPRLLELQSTVQKNST